jgi:hypothetical protein
MNGCIAIDFEPGSGAVPHILRTISANGLDLCGFHLVPSCSERSTLMVDLGNIGWEEMVILEARLRSVTGIIGVIHTAAPQVPLPPAQAAAAAAHAEA